MPENTAFLPEQNPPSSPESGAPERPDGAAGLRRYRICTPDLGLESELLLRENCGSLPDLLEALCVELSAIGLLMREYGGGLNEDSEALRRVGRLLCRRLGTLEELTTILKGWERVE